MFEDLIIKKKPSVSVGLNCPTCNWIVFSMYDVYGYTTTGELQFKPSLQAFHCDKCNSSWHVYYDECLSPIETVTAGSIDNV